MDFIYLMLCFVMMLTHTFARTIPKVAIVGGGIGGTSTAHFLIDLFGKDNIDIDLFEANKIGGRLATVKVAENEYETGGSIIHTSNKYMADFISSLRLKRRKHSSTQDTFGLYDGEKFIFIESGWNWLTVLKLAWRYGYSLTKIDDIIETMLKKFARIYKLQAEHKTYATVKDLLYAMDPTFPEQMKNSTYNGFTKDGISSKVIDELVMASLQCNYGQDTSVHQFVGSVSMAGMQGSLYSIEGGNKKVPETIVAYHKLKVLHSKVLKVSYRKPENKYDVNFVTDGKVSSKDYDFVVIATPLTPDLSKLQCLNFPDEASKCTQQGHYHRTVSSIVEGKVNSSFFDSISEEELPTDVILTNKNVFFKSLSKIAPVSPDNHVNKNSSDVYKVFSPKPLTDDELKLLFKEVKSVHIQDWLAYPEYDKQFVSNNFIISNRFYYLNAIESAASAMEMSAISAKNIALLVFKSWKPSATVEMYPKKKLNDELR